MTMSIAFGADDAAVGLKELLIAHLQSTNYEVTDYSNDCGVKNPIYPDIAWTVAMAIKDKKHTRGILLCGTGIGMNIVANKVEDIRSAQCHDTFSAERARKSNDAQIITMGARVIGPELAKKILDAWLTAEFEGGASLPKVEKISHYEQASKISE